jgi:predicted PurR-regulated permease PerM
VFAAFAGLSAGYCLPVTGLLNCNYSRMTNEKVINKYVYGAFILALAALLFSWLKDFFSSFLGAIVFYTLFRKLMNYLTCKKKMGKTSAALLIIFISFVIVVLPIGILGTVLFNKISTVVAHPQPVIDMMHKLTDRLQRFHINVSNDNIIERAQGFVAQNMGNILNSSFGILGSLIMMYFFLFFLLYNIHHLEDSIIRYLPFRRSKLIVFGKELLDHTYSNAIGVPMIGVVQGFLAFLSYKIAGVPEAGLWGILTGFASIVPLVGTGMIWLPVTLWTFANGEIGWGIFLAVYSIAIMTQADNVIRMIIGRRIGNVHPIVTVLGVLIGLRYFGLPGLVFGPLILSYFVLILKLYHHEYIRKPEPELQPLHAETKDTALATIFRLLQKRFAKKGGGAPIASPHGPAPSHSPDSPQ